MEDIIEEIVRFEIVDEFDQFVSNKAHEKEMRQNFDYDALRLLDANLIDDRLNHEEVMALSAHLKENVSPIRHGFTAGIMTDDKLTQLLQMCSVVTLKEFTGPSRRLSVVRIKESQRKDRTWLFHRDTVATKCAIVLSGRITVLAGKDDWRSEVGMFGVLGQDCLTNEGNYYPDFCAYVASETARVVYLHRRLFAPVLQDRPEAMKLATKSVRERSLDESPLAGQASQARVRGPSGSGDESVLDPMALISV